MVKVIRIAQGRDTMMLPTISTKSISKLAFPVLGHFVNNNSIEIVIDNGVVYHRGEKVLNIDLKGMMRVLINKTRSMDIKVHALVSNTVLSADGLSVIVKRRYDILPGETDIEVFNFTFNVPNNITYGVVAGSLSSMFAPSTLSHKVCRGEKQTVVKVSIPKQIRNYDDLIDTLSKADSLNHSKLLVISPDAVYTPKPTTFREVAGGYIDIRTQFTGNIVSIEPKLTDSGFVAESIVTMFDNGKKVIIPIEDAEVAERIWKERKRLLTGYKQVTYSGTFRPHLDSTPTKVNFVRINY